MFRSPRRSGSGQISLLAASTAVVLLASACATGETTTSSGEEVTIDVGGGRSITVEGPLRIANFAAGSSNAYLAAARKSMDETVADIPGASVVTFDPQWNPQTQLNQIENAIASKKYNAFIVDPVDGELVCNAVTQDAPEANIAVIGVGGALCGLWQEPSGLDQWAEGTVGQINNNSYDWAVDWITHIVEENPGPQKVITIQGPSEHALAQIADEAFEEVESENPDFQVVADGYTDFSRLQGQQKTQALLSANPDATILYSAYSDVTEGALVAIEQAGMEGRLKVYNGGVPGSMVEAMTAGTVTASTPYYPLERSSQAVQLLVDAFAGELGDRVILNDGGPIPADANQETGLVVIDQSNVAEFRVEY